MAYVYKLTATNNVGRNVGQNKQIPSGTVLQVISSCIPHPSAKEISQAIKAQFGLDIPEGCCSSGNFKVEQVK